MSFNLFVYGSLKDPLLFREITGLNCMNKVHALLPGYGYSQPYGIYPVIRSRLGDSVLGQIIFNIPDEALNRLGEYEGEAYRRECVTLSIDGRDISAYVYVGP